MITDYADNLERIARVIASVDTPAGMDTDVVKLQQGIAVDVAAMVAPLLDAQGAEPGQKVVVMADPRSNSVLLRSSSPGRTRLARQLVEKLDRAGTSPATCMWSTCATPRPTSWPVCCVAWWPDRAMHRPWAATKASPAAG